MLTSQREPRYWMHEQSGVLTPVIMAYLHGDELTPQEFGIMRAYLRQWVNATVWEENPSHTEGSRKRLENLRQRIDALHTRKDVGRWLFDAVEEGMDPL